MPLEHVVFTLPDALTSVQLLIDRASGKASPDVDTHCLVKAGLVVLGFANDQVLKHGPRERPPLYSTASGEFDREVAVLDEAKAAIKALTSGENLGASAAAAGDNPVWWKLIDLIPEILKDLLGKYFK